MTTTAATAALLTIVVCSAPLALPVSSASEVTCQGEPATLVGTPGQSLQGTEGPDVVVSNGAIEVLTGAGDDLVCVTEASAVVVTGAGDDMVDARAIGSGNTGAVLGAGSDSYLGGEARDLVDAHRWERDADGFGEDTDVVSTAGGHDVVVTGGRPGFPDTDQVDLGTGGDRLDVFGRTSAAATTHGGPGFDGLVIEHVVRAGRWRIDNRQGLAEVTSPGHLREQVASWDSLERFQVLDLPAGSDVVFLGGDADEWLTVEGPPTVAGMGRGDDLVDVQVGRRMAELGLRVHGGRGRDGVSIERTRSLRLDLATGVLRFGGAGAGRSSVSSIEDARVQTERSLTLVGTAGTDNLIYAACSGSVSAEAGDDSVDFQADTDWVCVKPSDVPVLGGPGDDVLRGGRHDDHLVGGLGFDTADGRSGHDVCVAERTRRCEA